MDIKLKLWQIGLIVFILGGLVNAIFIQAGVGGLLREMMRLVILGGLGIFIFGLVKHFRKKYMNNRAVYSVGKSKNK